MNPVLGFGFLLLQAITVPTTYVEARSLAQSSERSLSADRLFELRHASGKVLGEALLDCRRDKMDLSGFTIVLAIQANGAVYGTWRHGETELAKCVQERLSSAILSGSWPTPFYTAIELSRNAP